MNSFIKSFVFFILQISIFCIQNGFCASVPRVRIENGNSATSEQFPWQTSIIATYLNSLNNKLTKFQYCSGSIISKEWIITAAHCIHGSKNITLGFDSLNWFDPKLTIGVKQFIIHPGYKSRTYRNDIALIQLISPLEFTKNINAILLPVQAQSEISFDGVKSIISGWGIIVNDQNQTQTQAKKQSKLNLLKWAELSVISNSICATEYGSIITDSTICAQGSKGENVCGSDFGGPLITQDERGWLLIGIASFTQGCDSSNKPIGFIRITSFLDWISKESGIVIP